VFVAQHFKWRDALDAKPDAGNRYLDLFGGVGRFLVGYHRELVRQCMRNQVIVGFLKDRNPEDIASRTDPQAAAKFLKGGVLGESKHPEGILE